MSGEDWYRKRTWTENDRRDFFSRLKRARRGSQAQYLRIQAAALQEAGNLSGALELLNYMLMEWPNPVELAAAHLQKAQCLDMLGRKQEAIQAFRDALDAERRHPNVRTNAPLDFGMFVIRHQLNELYDQVSHILKEFPGLVVFPYQEYQYHAIQAVIAHANGAFEAAREHARQAILASQKEFSGFRRHQKVGLVKQVDAELQTILRQISAP